MAEIRPYKVGHSECRSFGSTQHQSGRSAKVSIGITVEKSPTVVSGIRKDASGLHSSEKHLLHEVRSVAKQSQPQGTVTLETTKVELKEQKNSNCSDKFYANQLPVPPSVDTTHKIADELADGHNKKECGDTFTDQGHEFTTIKEKNLIDQEIIGEPTRKQVKSTTNGLKLKLWEILGGDPSQKEHSMNSPLLDEIRENISMNNNQGLQRGNAARPKPYSDPIETDSDSHNQTERRPTTRSMTNKKAPCKIVKKLDVSLNNGKKPLSATYSYYKHKADTNLKESGNEPNFTSFVRENKRKPNQNAYSKNELDDKLRKICGTKSDNNPNVQTNVKSNNKDDIFSFAELAGNSRASEKSANSQIKRLKDKRNAAIEPRTTYLPTNSSSKSTLQRNINMKSFPAPLINDINTSPCLPCSSKTQSIQSKNVPTGSRNSQMNAQNRSGIPLVPKAVVCNNAQSPMIKKGKEFWQHMNSSSTSKFVSQYYKAACSPVKCSAGASDDLQSPTLAAGNVTPTSPSRPAFEISGSPLPRKKLNFTWSLSNSDSMDIGNHGYDGSKVNTESSQSETRDVYESRDLESTFAGGDETKGQLSLTPKARHDSDSLEEEELKIKGFRKPSIWFPNVDDSDKSSLKLHKKRKIHCPKDAKLRVEAEDLQEDASGQDDFARAVNQLALALRRITSKIQTHANKKSCEMLSAVAERIKQQLQDADSKIQEDIGKFNGGSKSKRKRLESRFEEQQEQLRVIHEKFKEEVNHQLQNCSGTLEELKAQNLELKATADRQKVVHRKLLSQIEEAVKVQLTAAESSISAIKKDARKKLSSLKIALKEWVSDGTIS